MLRQPSQNVFGKVAACLRDWCDAWGHCGCVCACSCPPKSYRADLTDAQWELIARTVPSLPGGRPPTHARRGIVDAIQYVNRTGCAWRQLPHDFPPWQTVYWYFKTWNDEGVTARIDDALRAAVRDRDGRDPMASAGIVDAQSIKGADTVGRNSRGYDAGKKITAVICS